MSSGEANESKETAASTASEAKDNVVPPLKLQEQAPDAAPHVEPPQLDASAKAVNDPSEQPDATSPDEKQEPTSSDQPQNEADSQQPEPSEAADTQRSANSTASSEVATLSAKFGLTVEEIASLRSVFKMFDEDENGSIDMGEMINVLKYARSYLKLQPAQHSISHLCTQYIRMEAASCIFIDSNSSTHVWSYV